MGSNEMKSVTIIGRGPSWKECPFATEELWGTATCLATEGLKDKNYTKVFAFDGVNEILTEALKEAKERNIPVVSTLSYATELYPLVPIVRHFQVSYFKTSISYMLAYAIYQGYKSIRIDGIDQGPGWLYQQGKPYITFWLGVATGRGIEYRMGRDSLKWTYRIGQNGLPEAFILREGIIQEV